jgi:hypothetical protein
MGRLTAHSRNLKSSPFSGAFSLKAFTERIAYAMAD